MNQKKCAQAVGVSKPSPAVPIPELAEELYELLQDDVPCDTMSADALEAALEEMKKSKVKAVHHYAITQPTSSFPYWTTYYKPEGGSRKKIYGKDERDLYKKLYKLYYFKQFLTLQDVHEEWALHRQTMSLSPRTLTREEQRWERFFANTKLADTLIRKIDDVSIEDHVHELIRNNALKAKELQEIMHLLRGAFRYAVKRGILFSNPMDTVEINKAGCAPAPPRGDRSRVYLTEEQEAMMRECEIELENDPGSSIALAIMLNFHLGLRIGELVALRESDIDRTFRTIHIQRMETKDANDKPVIVNHLKKKSRESNRLLPLSEQDLAWIDQALEINRHYGYQEEDYIFQHAGGRIHIRALDNRIRKLCRRIGIPAKSCHDIRRTVASRLHARHVSIEKIRAYMGHSEASTTWGYIYDVDSENESNRQILAALSG